MLSMEEKKAFVYSSPKRRCYFISSIVLIFLVLFGICVLAGYFIGRGTAKSCDDGDKNDGCNPPKGHTQEQLEEFHKRAVDMISTKELKNSLKRFTKVPHFPGGPENFKLVEDMAKKWKEYGIDVIWKNYTILLSRPKDMKAGSAALYNGSTLLHKSAPQGKFLVPLKNNSNVVPPFNAYAPSGSVRGMYRLPVEEAKKLLPQFPVHPISYKDAEPLLRTLTRDVVPSNSSFRGGLKFSYGIQMAEDDPRHVVLVHSPTIYYNWYGGVVYAIYRARKGLVTKEEVKKQILIVAYGINSAAQILKLSPIE